MNIDTETLSLRLKELRKSLNITQSDFAESINVSTVSVSSYESGAKTPSFPMIVNIATTYHVSIDWLCGFSCRKSLGETPKTYSELFEILSSALGVCFEGHESMTLLDSITIESNRQCKMLFTPDENFNEFILGWFKMYKLYHDKTIDKELYKMWLQKELPKYNYPINGLPPFAQG